MAPNSSSADSLVDFIVMKLRMESEITDAIGSKKVASTYWPAAVEAWSTKSFRDAFFAAPALPRLLDPNTLKRTVVDGVTQDDFAYACKDTAGRFDPLHFQCSITEADIEFSEETFLLRAADAQSTSSRRGWLVSRCCQRTERCDPMSRLLSR